MIINVIFVEYNQYKTENINVLNVKIMIYVKNVISTQKISIHIKNGKYKMEKRNIIRRNNISNKLLIKL